MQVGRASANLLLSYVAKSFSDPVNTVIPSSNGAVGLVPAYTLVDLNVGLEGTEWLQIRAGINNLFDRQYFTKRPQFYPGPGVWPNPRPSGKAPETNCSARDEPRRVLVEADLTGTLSPR